MNSWDKTTTVTVRVGELRWIIDALRHYKEGATRQSTYDELQAFIERLDAIEEDVAGRK